MGQMYGCRVIQKALEVIGVQRLLSLVSVRTRYTLCAAPCQHAERTALIHGQDLRLQTTHASLGQSI
jgi:hypothetical protein